MTSKLFNYKEVAVRYGVLPRCVRGWVSTGKIGYLKLGKPVRFTEEHLHEFERKHTVKATV